MPTQNEFKPRYFNWREFDSRDVYGGTLEGSGCSMMDRPFVADLDLVRDIYGKPIVVSSGYRMPAYNQLVSTTGITGPHTTGKAADLKASGADAFRLLMAVALVKLYRAGVIHTRDLTAKTLDRMCEASFQGIGFKQDTSTPHQARFIHLDSCEPGEAKGLRPWVWTY